MRSASATVAALLLAGCPGPTFVVQQYAGPQRPSYTVAILRVNGNEEVRLLELDGKDVAAPILEDGRLHIEVLPARHTVSAARASAPREGSPPVAFTAEAGRVYRVAFVATAPHVFEVDREKDSVVRDVTEPGAPPPE